MLSSSFLSPWHLCVLNSGLPWELDFLLSYLFMNRSCSQQTFLCIFFSGIVQRTAAKQLSTNLYVSQGDAVVTICGACLNSRLSTVILFGRSTSICRYFISGYTDERSLVKAMQAMRYGNPPRVPLAPISRRSFHSW